MLKLMKYELQRRIRAIFIVLAIIAVIEGIVLFGLHKGGAWLVGVFILNVLMVVGVYLFILFDGVRTYYTDLNRNEGYMVFLTPNSGYKIIGSKAIISFFELLFFVMITVSILLINYFIAKNLFINSSAEAKEFFDSIAYALRTFTPTVGQVFLLSFVTILQWFNVIMVAMLSITLTKTVLSNNKLSWLISLGFFIAISTALQFLDMGIISIFGFIGDMKILAGLEAAGASDFIPTFSSIIFKYVGISAVIYSVYISIFYFLSGRLVHKRISI